MLTIDIENCDSKPTRYSDFVLTYHGQDIIIYPGEVIALDCNEKFMIREKDSLQHVLLLDPIIRNIKNGLELTSRTASYDKPVKVYVKNTAKCCLGLAEGDVIAKVIPVQVDEVQVL